MALVKTSDPWLVRSIESPKSTTFAGMIGTLAAVQAVRDLNQLAGRIFALAGPFWNPH